MMGAQLAPQQEPACGHRLSLLILPDFSAARLVIVNENYKTYSPPSHVLVEIKELMVLALLEGVRG